MCLKGLLWTPIFLLLLHAWLPLRGTAKLLQCVLWLPSFFVCHSFFLCTTELELTLGMQWHHMAMLQFLKHFVQAAFLVLTELILGTLSVAVGARHLQLHPTVEMHFWRLDTNSNWWDWLVMEQCDDQQWLQNFCMWKATFFGAVCLTRRHPPET